MADVIQNKVDMSLDDIIKISRSEKRKEARLAKQQNFGFFISRGRGNNAGTGIARGQVRGRGRGRGRGNSIQHNVNKLKQFRTNLHGFKRGRGRGRGITHMDTTENPLSHKNKNQLGLQSRGRGRGRSKLANLQRTPLIFTNSQLKQTVQQSQRQSLNETKQQAALLRKKQLALKNLQQAKQNFESINLALQKTSREYVVNQMRGLNTHLTTPPSSSRGRSRGRGRGRGRGSLVLSLTPEIDQNNINTPIRQLNNTSVTVINSTPLNSDLIRGGKRRRWRGGKQKTEHFTIQVANQRLQPVKQEASLVDQLKLLKPAVSTSYKFQKNVFAAPATGVSLNERFSGPSLSSNFDDVEMIDGRKVFM